MGVMDDLARAREAFERREWMAAYDVLSGRDESELAPVDFDQLGTAAFLVGRTNDAVVAWQRAHQANLDAGEVPAAARMALRLAMTLMMSGEPAIGAGWVARAQRLLDELEHEVAEHGFLLSMVMVRQVFSGEFDAAIETSARVLEYGHRFDEQDLVALALMARGRSLIYAGRVREGLTELDEAMARLAAGDVSPVMTGEVYCSLIEACQEVADFDRAAELTSALSRWVDSQPDLVRFTGQCALHRGQIMRAQGALDQALQEFEQSVERYAAIGDTGAAGVTCGEWGDVLRLTGDLAGAQETYDRAVGFGHEPQPGLALLWLASSRTEEAASAILRLLEERRNPVERARLLPAAVEVLLAVGDGERASDVAEELARVADDFGCRPLHAMAAHAVGATLLAEQNPAGALPELRRGFRGWQELSAPYDAARSRVLIGLALRALGDEGSATQELEEARATFARVGATPDVQRVAGLLGGVPAPGGLTERELEVLRLVATGKSNPEIAATLVLSEKTVARHLSNIFTKLDVPSRTAAAAYAFQHRLV